MALLTNQTAAVPGFMSQQPQAALRARGLGALGQETEAQPGTTWQEIQAGVNSQLLWFINLDRLQSGKEALAPEMSQPQVTAKLDPQTKNILTLAALGIGGILLLAVAKR